MSNPAASGSNRATFRLVLASTLLGLVLLATLVMCVWWAVDRIDARSLEGERASLTAALQEELQRLSLEQDSSAEWDDAVVKVRERDQTWIAENLTDWMSDFFGHTRVYVIAPNNRVIRAAEMGEHAESTLAPTDVAVLLPRISEMRHRMAEASFGRADSTAAISEIGVAEVERLSNDQLALISVRPIVPSSQRIAQAPGTEALIASVKFLDDSMLEKLSERLGIHGLTRVDYSKNQATIQLQNADGYVVGYLGWTPNHPAAAMLIETAPATITLLLIGLGSLVSVLMWVRITLTKLGRSREEAAYLGMHDPLTGAANRILFDRKLKEATQYQYLGDAKVLLVAIDIDHFKDINDKLGHAGGDQLLSQVTDRLKFELAEEATLGRLGGDEFAIVQPAVVSEGQALWICQRLVNALQQPFHLDDSATTITFSLGIALEEGAKIPPSEILRRADVALYVAKKEGRNRLKLYDPEMDRSKREKRALEIELRHALITGDGLHLAYQPVFTARSGDIAGAEALVRWKHPTRGNISPDEFIGMAEETGVIDQLGLWVLQEACKTAARIGLPSVAVNVSPVQFRDELLADRILDVLRNTGLAPAKLEIEITEGLLLQNSPAVQKTLGILRDAGVRVALDDFGTGYSSISYLRSHAIDRLKIDRSFTRMVTADHATARIVRSVIEMAEALGMSVTAEGVEDEAQRRTLAQMGCSHLQGFLLSRPIGEADLVGLLSGHQSDGLIRLFGRTDTGSV